MKYISPVQRKLTDLPVELLTELYLTALEPSFPQICKYIYHTVKSFPPSIHAQYLYGRHQCTPLVLGESVCIPGTCFTRTLLHPICTVPVLKAMIYIISPTSTRYTYLRTAGRFELPKRLFRTLGEDPGVLGPHSEPLPLLRFLWGQHSAEVAVPAPILDMANSHSGYPLVRAVHAGFIHLIRFLLGHGADPTLRGCMAVKVAIGKKDLSLVKLLIEFEPEGNSSGGSAKRRRRLDRVTVQTFMLDLAVRCDARDIVRYLIHEKGCVPHLSTLEVIEPVSRPRERSTETKA